MTLLYSFLTLVAGVLFLSVGAKGLVHAAQAVALRWGLAPSVVGLTLVAAGTSAPELFASLVAAFRGAPDVAVGNIVGSNVLNLLVVVGLSALVAPLRFGAQARQQMVWLLVLSVGFVLLMLDLHINRIEGGALVGGLLGAGGYILHKHRANSLLRQPEISAGASGSLWSLVGLVVLFAAGVGALIYGAQLFISGGLGLGDVLGLDARMVGVLVVSFGTSCPEIATSVVAALKKEGGMAFGNAVGSNILNMLCVGGVTAWVQPLELSEQILKVDSVFMLFVTVVLMLLCVFNKRAALGFWHGLFLCLLYCLYVVAVLA